MDRKEEDKVIASRKRRYLFGVVAVFMTVYVFLYLVLTILNFVAEMNPYLKLFLMLVFFIVSFYVTRFTVTLKDFQEFVCRK